MNAGWRAFALCTLVLTVAGCAMQGPAFERVYPPAGHAAIYVYRPYSYAGSLLRPAVTCGDDTSRIGPGAYHVFIVPAGQDIDCTVHSNESADDVRIHAEPRAYYIKEQIGWGLLTGHPHLNPMDTDQAHTEIQRCCVQQGSLP